MCKKANLRIINRFRCQQGLIKSGKTCILPKSTDMKRITGYCLVFILTFFSLTSYAGKPTLYLATDKEQYGPAEFIQYQLFLLQSPDNNKTVYVELLDCKGNLLEKKMLPLNAGICWGNIELPQTPAIPFYVLYCYVINKDTVETDCSKKIIISTAKPAGNLTSEKMVFHSFAEGGTFVAEIPNNLLITCTDERGNPVVISGNIINEKKLVITSFTTDESGLAKINFIPFFKEQYFIVAQTKQGHEITKEIPPASDYGVQLTVSFSKDSFAYTVYSFNADEKKLDYKLTILSNGSAIYESYINFQPGLSIIKEVLSLKDQPAGFLTLKLTDKNNKLYAQRLIFNESQPVAGHFIKIIDTVSKKAAMVMIPGYANGLAYLNIIAGNPAAEGQKTALTLGDITDQPAILNNNGKETTFNDLLIGNRKEIQSPVAERVDAKPFLSLAGRAFNSENKPLKNRQLNLVFLHKNLKKEYRVVTTDRTGHFEMNALIFYDTVTVYYQLADNSEEKNNIRVDLQVTPNGKHSGNEINTLNFICATAAVAAVNPGNRVNSDSAHITTVQGEKTMQEVTVKSIKEKPKTDSEKFVENNISAQHNQATFMRNEFDFVANPEVIDTRPIFEYLRGRISLSINLSFGGKILIRTFAGDGIGVYLDDMDVSGSLDQVSLLQVKDIALVRYYSLPLKPRTESTNTKYSSFGSNGSGGDLMIYTKKGFTNTEIMVKGLPKTKIVGYDIQKTEIVHTATADTALPRSLYWKPNWTAQKDQVIYIALPATTAGQHVQLTIEGINNTQTPFVFTKKLDFN